ncbi:hypothetical protein CASFOL_002627 [Castilleja foliolosa]|uniref:Uncharacterized protein n=1 Tax=Castilleja foliolosa TaxID=1961234 RepID=A0ABD3EIA8_9LAMI
MASDKSQQLSISSVELIEAREKCDFIDSSWENSCFQVQVRPRRRCRCVGMKRRARLDRRNSIERKVKILKKLVPNCESSIGVERLFSETADYILALEMRVKVMQSVVNVISGSDE